MIFGGRSFRLNLLHIKFAFTDWRISDEAKAQLKEIFAGKFEWEAFAMYDFVRA